MDKVVLTAMIFAQILQCLSEMTTTEKNACPVVGQKAIQCCSGFYRHKGQCIECIGSSGSNCSEPCRNGFYGKGCRTKCDCQKNETCNKYIGCQSIYGNNNHTECDNTVLVSVICVGSILITLALIFVGFMIYKSNLLVQNKNEHNLKTGGFAVNLIKLPGKQEERTQENYDDIRESRMILDDSRRHNQETVEKNTNSTDYNRLFCKSVGETGEDNYGAIDARFGGRTPLVALTEFPEDDCYVSVSKNAKQSKRMSKSCTDLTTGLSGIYYNARCNKYYNTSLDDFKENVLIEHL